MTAIVTRVRLSWVDTLRGLAVALMILDHALFVFDGPAVLRLTVTRPALPLFLFCAAAVLRGRPSSRRTGQLVAAGIAETLLLSALGFPQPGPVLLIGLVLVAAGRLPQVFLGHPLLVGTLGLLQALYVPLPWTGYQPGLVVAWFSIGLLGAFQLADPARWLAARSPSLAAAAGWMGRRPLSLYVGHLGLLLFVVTGLGLS